MEARPPLEVVAGLLIRDGRVLVARRGAEARSNAGLWEFPGGKVEPGESHAAALARELREELGVDVEVGAHLLTVDHRYPALDIRLHAYFCTLPRGEPSALEHAELRYVEPGELGSLPFAPANVPIARTLAEPLTESAVAPDAGGPPWRA